MKVANNPNNITGILFMSTPPTKIGITNDAKNTSEKFAQRIDSARSFDFVNLNIKLMIPFMSLKEQRDRL